MDWLRHTLIACMIGVLIALVFEWNKFEAPQSQAVQTNTIPTMATAADSDVPSIPRAVPEEVAQEVSTDLIPVTTPLFNILIDPRGGDIVSLSLVKHTVNEDDPTPLQILVDNAQNTFVAQSGLLGKNGTDDNSTRPIFSATSPSFEMGANDTLSVDLSLSQGDVNIIKSYIFAKDSYEIKVQYTVENNSDQVWSAHLYGQMKRDDHPPYNSTAGMMNSFLGMATTNKESNFHKLDFDDISDRAYSEDFNGGWIALIQHYFVSAWVPATDGVNNYFAKPAANGFYLMGFTSSKQEIAAGDTGSFYATFYSGPKDQKTLAELGDYLDLSVDYSWLWWLAKPLFWALTFFHGLLGNWGLAIIAVTVLIKAFFYYPSAVSYRSMAKLRKFTPLMQEIRDRYADDRQKQQMEMMKLYKEEKINPMAGCLPILIQMPVFLAFYWMLMESVELRQAPFMLWITDLSVKDPYFVLPILMAVIMFLQQKLNPPATDPMQQKIMQMMPLIFGFFFMMFPAGLVLYWLFNSLLSMVQQLYIYKTMEKSAK